MRYLPCALILGLALSGACTSKKDFKGGTQQGSTPKPKPVPIPVPPQAPAPIPLPLPPVVTLPNPPPLPAPLPEPMPAPAKMIEFGADKVFRIGDGNASKESACVAELMGYDLKGSAYFFHFEVLENQTKVDLAIAKICGVDSGNNTVISLVDKDGGKTIVAEQSVPTDSKNDLTKPYTPFMIPLLNKGNYTLVIRSKSTLGISDEVAMMNYPGLDHHDDFIVGNIMLNGDKLLRGLKVTTE